MKAEDRREKIAVIVGTVTNDIRILTLPKLKVGCLRTLYQKLYVLTSPRYVGKAMLYAVRL